MLDMFSSPNKKVKIEATHARLVEARVVDEGQDEFDVDGAMTSGVKALNQSNITYKLISPHQSTSPPTMANSSNVQANVPVGQFYVIGHPSEIATASGGRVLAPKTTTLTIAQSPNIAVSDALNTSASRRIDRRRQTHNEVERRRRDTINAWIMQLGKLIPDLDMDEQEKGPPKGGALSKGGILAKACDHVTELNEDNKTLLKRVKELENVESENERLREENAMLKQRLENHGISPVIDDILGS